METGPVHAPGELIIDLGAIAANYATLCETASPSAVAAVVKADAYGLGIAPVSNCLYSAGARLFFTAHLDEAIALRAVLPRADAEIGVLNGVFPGEEGAFAEHRLFPVLNDLGQIDLWQTFCAAAGALFAAIQLDTGMARLGLPPYEIDRLAAELDRMAGFETRYLISHMACADMPDHPLNEAQRARFDDARARLPHRHAMLAASSAIFLGEGWRCDFVRPGVALYGGRPRADMPNPMRQVIQLSARILQVRTIDAGTTVGYGASYRAQKRTKVATVGVGYADGYLRSASGRASAFLNGVRVPMVGRVSMDLLTFDVTQAGPVAPGDRIDLIGPDHTIDDLADEAGTIGYEILTSLGKRYRRRYIAAGTGEGSPL